MRFRLALLMMLALLLPAVRAGAHLADEFPQVTLQVAIDEEAVELIVSIPAKDAKLAVFDGMSPVEMDKMEPEALSAMIGPVFASRCPVMIDGVVVPPVILGGVVDMSNSRLPARRFPEPQVLKQGSLKFLARYETKGDPRNVALQWSIFANEYDAEALPIHSGEGLQVVGLVNAEGREQVVLLTPGEPGYTWHADGAMASPMELLASQPVPSHETTIPALSTGLFVLGGVVSFVLLRRSTRSAAFCFATTCVLSAALFSVGTLKFIHSGPQAALSDEQSLDVFESLHRNIYRAFDYTDEGAVYDALAQSVDGPMLETIYNDVYQSLIMREENGAVSKVVRVEIERSEVVSEAWIGPARSSSEPKRIAPDEPGAFTIDADWRVDGVVTHFGHTHTRTNAFSAVYTVAPRAGGWRIVDAHIVDQQRIDNGWQAASDALEQVEDETGDADQP